MTSEKKAFLTVLGMEIVADVVGETDTYYEVEKALGIAITKDAQHRITNIDFGPITGIARSADAEGVNFKLQKSHVLMAHTPIDDVINGHTRVTNPSKIQMASADTLANVSAIIDAADKFKK